MCFSIMHIVSNFQVFIPIFTGVRRQNLELGTGKLVIMAREMSYVKRQTSYVSVFFLLCYVI